MIADAAALADLRVEWSGVVQMRERMRLLVVVTFAGGAFTGPSLAKVVYNLPLLLAFDVLKQVLLQLQDEGRFKCPRRDLGPLLDHSRDTLVWLDWDRLRDGVRRRNQVAHDGVLFDSDQCLADISNVEAQLLAWSVLSAV